MTDNWHEKYRPRNLSEFWQPEDPSINAVAAMLKTGQLSQLLNFVGEFGCGKTSLARVIGRRFLCVNPEASVGNPCGACEGCQSLAGSFGGTIVTDGYIEYDASALSASHIVDSIQGHVIFNRLTPPPNQRFRRWIVCIDEMVHAEPKLQSMLVKLVENTKRARFILCYSDPSRIQGALVSRAVQLRLMPATTEQAALKIMSIANAEGFSLDAGAARMLVDSARCLPRDCIKLVELAAQMSDGADINLSAVQAALAMSRSALSAHG